MEQEGAAPSWSRDLSVVTGIELSEEEALSVKTQA